MRAFKYLLLINSLCMAALMSFVAVVGPLVRTLGLAEWHGGLAVTIAGTLWVASSRGWGRLSDVHGRKRVLSWALLGFCSSFTVLAAYFDVVTRISLPLIGLLALLIAIRGVMGLFYAAIPVVSNAWLADNFPTDVRRAVLAKLGAANAVGMVIGPLAAGLLATHNLNLPLYFAAGLPLLAGYLLWRHVPASAVVEQGEKPTLAFADRRVRLPVAAMFLATSAVLAGQMCVGFFAMDRLALDAQAGAKVAGLAMAGVGVALILIQLVVARLHRVSPQAMIGFGSLLAAAGFAPLFLTTTPLGLIASYSVAAAGLGMVFPAAQALAANAAAAGEQGLAAGTLSAAQGAASVVSPLAFTVLYQWNWVLPYLLACALLCVLSLLAMSQTRRIKVASA
ncbi:major facilitator superfamily protein [Cupriavidus basilensis OR16]|uniref:Major facilitator superfamily protein n=1 Tax=Cupriavidus basilensis OR16 TaxID=1127483 RepID=H1SA27_9BURK|nr:MFS transporter [Cupriavidus basilensis]EHP40576.1 major facilitator superfamily protein [Cupriavidus basilensis OR16]